MISQLLELEEIELANKKMVFSIEKVKAFLFRQ